MNMASVTVRINNQDIDVACTEGPGDVFSSTPFTIIKKRWIPDQEVQLCPLCANKFTQIRRKHHCRHCGKVYCNKCCDNKVALPHLGYEEPQRICDDCLPVSENIRKARSLQFDKKEEGAKGLANMAKDPVKLMKVVEYGGVQTLVYLGQSIDVRIKAHVADALHTLSTHTSLHPMLLNCGTVKALCSLLSTADEKHEKTVVDSLSALMILCKATEGKTQAICDGALQPILAACGLQEHIALLAVMTLSLIADNQKSLSALIETDRGALPRIMSLTNSKDEKMQEVSLKILASLSMGSDWHKHKIVQEDFACGKCIVNVIKRKPLNQQVLVNAACLIGNLAVCEQDQASLRDCLAALCGLLKTHSHYKDIQLQVARALANFSKFQVNASLLINQLPLVVKVYLRSSNKDTRYHALRIVTSLLTYSRDQAIEILTKESIEDYLLALFEAPGASDALQAAFLELVPDRCKPMSL